jgi:hypothetical protein
MAIPKPAGKKRGSPVGTKRDTLSGALKPFKEKFRAASRKPRGKMPSWFDTLSPALQASVRQEAFKADVTAMPSPQEIGEVVLDFWSK